MERIGLDEALQLFEEFLDGKGMRLTRQRRAILERLYNLDHHVSADDLSDLMRKDNRGISKATVYRTLALLEESGLIEGHDFRQGYLVYEFAHRHGRHDHILCVDGTTVVEFQSEKLEKLLAEITKSYGFEPISHQLVVYARCEQCREDPDHHHHSHGTSAARGEGHTHQQEHGLTHKLQLVDAEGSAADDEIADDVDTGSDDDTADDVADAPVSARRKRMASPHRLTVDGP